MTKNITWYVYFENGHAHYMRSKAVGNKGIFIVRLRCYLYSWNNFILSFIRSYIVSKHLYFLLQWGLVTQSLNTKYNRNIVIFFPLVLKFYIYWQLQKYFLIILIAFVIQTNGTNGYYFTLPNLNKRSLNCYVLL